MSWRPTATITNELVPPNYSTNMSPNRELPPDRNRQQTLPRHPLLPGSHLPRISGALTTNVVPNALHKHANKSTTSPSLPSPPPAPSSTLLLPKVSASEEEAEATALATRAFRSCSKGNGSPRAAIARAPHSSSCRKSYSRPSAEGRVSAEAFGETPVKR